jgi:hypothetical protein
MRLRASRAPVTRLSRASLATSVSPQIFRQRRRQLGFPVANRFMAENDAADQEHLRQITQGKLVTKGTRAQRGR